MFPVDKRILPIVWYPAPDVVPELIAAVVDWMSEDSA